jgi:hypothetical protein
MSLCEALHGRAAMVGVGAPWAGHGELTGEGRGRGRGGVARGGSCRRGEGRAVGRRLNWAAPLFGLPGCCT